MRVEKTVFRLDFLKIHNNASHHSPPQEDKSRVEIFKDFARKKKESVWQPFFHLLDRDDKFIVYQVKY